MFNHIRRRQFFSISIALAGASLAVAPSFVAAQTYPERPLRMVVPFPPGASTDNVARLLAKSMSESLGQTVVVENRAGAGGTIGAREVARSTPDGYTILASTAGIHIANPAIYKDLPYEAVKSWAPVSLTGAVPMAVVVLASSPFKTLQDLVDHAKKNPGKLSYASAGIGSALHQWAEIFKDTTKIDILHVPYKGGAPAVTDFLAGRTDAMFTYYSSVLENTRTGKTRILAVGSPDRLPLTPDVPTIGEAIPGLDSSPFSTWLGILAPAGTPEPIVARLNKAVGYALEQNRKHLQDGGYVVLGGSPQDMLNRMNHEFANQTPLLARLMAAPTSK